MADDWEDWEDESFTPPVLQNLGANGKDAATPKFAGEDEEEEEQPKATVPAPQEVVITLLGCHLTPRFLSVGLG